MFCLKHDSLKKLKSDVRTRKTEYALYTKKAKTETQGFFCLSLSYPQLAKFTKFTTIKAIGFQTTIQIEMLTTAQERVFFIFKKVIILYRGLPLKQQEKSVQTIFGPVFDPGPRIGLKLTRFVFLGIDRQFRFRRSEAG